MGLFSHHDETLLDDSVRRWTHDRRVLATWLQREAGGHFDGAQLRADGSSYVSFLSDFGPISVHDYWSFARPDFNSANRIQSYAEILSRQVPILTLGYNRPGAPNPSELIVFFKGEVVTATGYGEAFLPLIQELPDGSLVSLESGHSSSGTTLASLYNDEFLTKILDAIGRQTMRPPSVP